MLDFPIVIYCFYSLIIWDGSIIVIRGADTLEPDPTKTPWACRFAQVPTPLPTEEPTPAPTLTKASRATYLTLGGEGKWERGLVYVGQILECLFSSISTLTSGRKGPLFSMCEIIFEIYTSILGIQLCNSFIRLLRIFASFCKMSFDFPEFRKDSLKFHE